MVLPKLTSIKTAQLFDYMKSPAAFVTDSQETEPLQAFKDCIYKETNFQLISAMQSGQYGPVP